MNNKKLRTIILCAMFIALDIVITRFLSFEIASPVGPIRFDFQIVVAALCGYALGPFWAPFALVCSDLLGVMINTGSLSFFPGYTLTALLRGLLFGLLLYNHKVSPVRLVISVCAVFIPIDFFLSTLWLSIITGSSYISLMVVRVIPKSILLVTECVVTVALLQLFKLLSSKHLKI